MERSPYNQSEYVKYNAWGVNGCMSDYLEIPEFEDSIPFRTFLNDGMTIVYPHWHKEIEIIYSRKGKVNIGVDEDIVQLEEGEIFFFPSGKAHYFLASPDSERYVYQFNLMLFDERILRVSEDSLLSLFESGEPLSRNWPQSLAQKATELLVHLYEVEESKPVGMNYLTLGYLYQLIGNSICICQGDRPLQCLRNVPPFNTKKRWIC